MPNTQVNKSAEKRVRQDAKKRERNRMVRGYYRDLIREIRSMDDAEEVRKELPHAYSVLDKAVKKGVIHKKTASRYKSRLHKFAESLSE